MKKKLLALLLALVMVLGLVGTAGAATHTVKTGDNLSKIAAGRLHPLEGDLRDQQGHHLQPQRHLRGPDPDHPRHGRARHPR